MVGDGALANGEAAPSSVPPQPCCSSSKRKADVPTGDDGCSTKRKAAVEKPCDDDSMAVDGGCDDDDNEDCIPSAGVDEDGSGLIVDREYLRQHPAGVDENGDLIMDDELLEHLEWVKTLKIIDLRDFPSVKFWSDFRNDESEEEGEEVVQKPNTTK